MEMKVAAEITINGETALHITTTPPGYTALLLTTSFFVGRPFWAWNSIPAGQVIGCNFTDAPVATSNPTTNQSLIDGIAVAPEDVLTYAP